MLSAIFIFHYILNLVVHLAQVLVTCGNMVLGDFHHVGSYPVYMKVTVSTFHQFWWVHRNAKGVSTLWPACEVQLYMMFDCEHLSFTLEAEKCPARNCYGCKLMAETFLPGCCVGSYV
jgi:hypothetical protein